MVSPKSHFGPYEPSLTISAMLRMRRVSLVVTVALALVTEGARASAAEPEAAEPASPEGASGRADKLHPELGPKSIELGDDLVLALPEGMGYFDRVQGKKLMEKMGNRVDDSMRGLVFKREEQWLIVLKYVGDGYVKDDDAGDLKPDEILSSLKEGTEQANEFRKEKGIPALHVDNWS